MRRASTSPPALSLIGLFLFERQRAEWIPAALGSAAVLLVAAWIYVCMARSCLCRIYTAVSRDELPSIHRIWTARQFLAEVEPRIREAQGELAENWADAMPEPAGQSPDLTETQPSPPFPSPVPPAPPRLSLAAGIFVASLFAGALVDLVALRSTAMALQWLSYAVAFTEIGAAVFVFVEHHRGLASTGMQRLAIAALVMMGAVYYVRQVIVSTGIAGNPVLTAFLPGYPALREADAAAGVVLGAIGVVLLVLPRRQP
jgi:hypothetical protein